MADKIRKAAPNAFSGQNPNTPMQVWDTHPNRRFAVGEEVIPVDPSDVPITGQVIGHCAEDRIWVRWAHGIIDQQDVTDVMAKREYSLDSSRVDRVSYDSSSKDERARKASTKSAGISIKKGSEMSTRSDAYVGLRGAAALAAHAGFPGEAKAITAARLVAEALEFTFGNRPQRIAKSEDAAQALVNASEDLFRATQSLKDSASPEAVMAACAAERFFTASVAYDPLRETEHDDNEKIVEDALEEAQEVLPFKKEDK